MRLRGTIIAGLIVVELAIVGEAVTTLRGDPPAPSPAQVTDVRAASGSQLLEGGPHQLFAAGAHPVLSVDIGYADLTILPSKASQIDVSVSASSEFGVFREKTPITARADGETIRIATTARHTWSMGDDRMVTVLVPPGTQVTVVDAGNVKANGLRAEASFHSVGSGSIAIEDYDAPVLKVATSNGRISLYRVAAAHLDATSGNDRVDGTALQVRDGSVESDGRVSLGFATGSDTLVTAETSHGTITVSGFTPAASPAAERKSSADGDAVSASRTVRVGTGNGHLDVHSSDGDITLSQEGYRT